jgi:copper homeostasis protein
VRPRAGDFVYSRSEIETIRRDIEAARDLGADGIVVGALTTDGTVAVPQTRAFVQAASGLPITFHRALDAVRDTSRAIEELMELGVSRILTSGGASTALEGVDVIARLVDQADERITIVAGGGIRENNVREVIAATRVTEVHSRFVDEPSMRRLVSAARVGAS